MASTASTRLAAGRERKGRALHQLRTHAPKLPSMRPRETPDVRVLLPGGALRSAFVTNRNRAIGRVGRIDKLKVSAANLAEP